MYHLSSGSTHMNVVILTYVHMTLESVILP